MERKDISVIKFPEEGVTAANAEKVVEFIEMADQWRKRAIEALKVYVKLNKNIMLSRGSEYGFYEKPKKSIEDVEAVVNVLMQGKVDKTDIWKALNLAPGKAVKLAKDSGINLDGLVIDKITRTFGEIPQESLD